MSGSQSLVQAGGVDLDMVGSPQYSSAPHVVSALQYTSARTAGIVIPARCCMADNENPPGKAEERRAFLALAVFLAPVLAVGIVAGYGFLVWMIQLISGPPGPKF